MGITFDDILDLTQLEGFLECMIALNKGNDELSCMLGTYKVILGNIIDKMTEHLRNK